MKIENIIEIINEKDEIKYNEFIREAIENDYYNLVISNQEILIPIIEEHNNKIKKEK